MFWNRDRPRVLITRHRGKGEMAQVTALISGIYTLFVGLVLPTWLSCDLLHNIGTIPSIIITISCLLPYQVYYHRGKGQHPSVV